MELNSSNLRAMDYDGKNLTIEFRSGAKYEYYNVPEKVILGLQKAPSHGKFFSQNIKGNYQYRRK